jgi:hypothetical protein
MLFSMVLLLAAAILFSPPAHAQLNGFNIKGDMGLKSGSQAPPGAYVGTIFYRYRSDSIRNENGDEVSLPGDLGLNVGGVLVNVVTKKKFLGANYGFAVVLPFANGRIEFPRLDQETGIGLSDLYVQPVSLGWHFKRADLTTSYAFFAPTGRYTVGANDNTGLGMWGHEVNLGTTVYLTENKAWHAASNAAFEFHSKKEDDVTQVGNLLTLEGGVGRSFLQGAASLGFVYYGQWKLSDDTLTGLPALVVTGRNRSLGIGPEIQLPIARRKTLYGFITFRYHREVSAHTATQGDGFTLMLTFPTKPIKADGNGQ